MRAEGAVAALVRRRHGHHQHVYPLLLRPPLILGLKAEGEGVGQVGAAAVVGDVAGEVANKHLELDAEHVLPARLEPAGVDGGGGQPQVDAAQLLAAASEGGGQDPGRAKRHHHPVALFHRLDRLVL